MERFSREGTDTTCFISPELVGTVAPEIAATAHRVVREALTNVRKHARGATRVRVVVAAASSPGMEVSVRDDGRATRGAWRRGRWRSRAAAWACWVCANASRWSAAASGRRRARRSWETAAWLPRETAVVEP